MALGTLGSTLNDELNRLANGGTYRDMNQMVDEALAAKQWANRENINPYSTDTVGILNEIAGLGLDKRNWLDFNGVCNYIAGTTGLPAAAALRQVYPTTDLLTGVASYYVDGYAGTNYIPTTASGYMYLPGVASNNATSPDSNALDITGDLDIRLKLAMDNWRPSGVQALLYKWNVTGNQRSYRLNLNTDGILDFAWSTAGSAAITAQSTVSTGIADGATKWIRVTLDVDNGASGNTTTFYTSDDGTNWTQLGNTVVQAGTTSIYAGTSILAIGSLVDGTFAARGEFFRAQILNGIGGTVAFDANFETAMTSQTVASFTESSSNAATVTINRTTYNFQLDTINNLGAAGSLLPTTLGSSTAADSNDPKFLDFTGTNYVYTTGVSGNYLSVPDAAALDITGDIDLRAFIAPDSWTPSATQRIITKFNGTDGNLSYILGLTNSGGLQLSLSSNGTLASTITTTSAVLTATAGTPLWVRVTWRQSDGRVQFFTSTDGATWTQLGTNLTNASASIFASISNVEIGSSANGTGNLFAGKVFRAQIFNGIDGTKVLDVDTSVITAGSATSFTAVTGQTVTINRSTSGRKTVAVTQPTWLFGTDDYMEVNNRYMSSGTYLYLPGVASNYASAPDSAALDITGDIDLRVKVALDDWTPSAQTGLLGKWNGTGGYAYYFSLNTNGTLRLDWSDSVPNYFLATSTVATGITDGTTKWVRVTLDVNNGASGRDIQFFTSDDGSSWTQLGTTVTQAGTTSIAANTSQLSIGAVESTGGTHVARGKFFRAQVLNGINGTVAFDANFETSITSLNQASFTESSANAATVTINRSGSAYRSAGITTAGYLYPGATNTFSASATDFLNFGASDSFTAMTVVRQWTTVGGNGNFINKGAIYVSQPLGWNISTGRFVVNSDSVNNVITASIAVTSSVLTSIFGVRNKATTNIVKYMNNVAGTAVTDTTGSLDNIGTVRIARDVGINYTDMEFIAAAVFRTALTAAQIRQISNYFANREVYL